MRYFRDLGADAHLLLYTNDGKGSLSHFKPECDTWDIAKWQPYIHQTSIPNAPIAALNFPYSFLMVTLPWIRSKLGLADVQISIISKRKIFRTYNGYDCLIGSGISPATLHRIGIFLDIFYPYSSGVEFLGTGEFLVRLSGRLGINKFLYSRVAQQQAEGIRQARNIINADMGLTNDVLLDLNTTPKNIFIPMVYDLESLPEIPPTKVLRDIWDASFDANFTLLHHARLMWCNPGSYSNDAWIKENKNSDWILRAFSDLVKLKPAIRAQILIVEYGPDVDATKKLAQELGISSHVQWLPKMDRRDLLWLLSRVSMGVGEFYNVPRLIWGGTGWEVLASGKPLIQGFWFAEDEFEKIYGYPPPPMLPVRNQDDILRHLLDMADNVEKRVKIGQAAKKWFENYNGIGLAKRWLEIVTNTCEGGVYRKNSKLNQGVHG